ncbi:MAG: hypothetical protein IT381_20630 [Deltaproteobacteria bacterium]|nr:hypothetical protein [Deltaproteobacteria bacterium]
MSRCSAALLLAILLGACGPLPLVDTLGPEKVAAMPVRAAAVRSDTEALTAIALFSNGPLSAELGTLEVATREGEYVPVADFGPNEHAMGALWRTAFLVPARVDRLFWRLVPARGAGVFERGGKAVVGGTLAFSAAFAGDNSVLNVTISDPLATLEGGGIERDYALRVVDLSGTQDFLATTTRALTTALSVPLTPEGLYSVELTTERATLKTDVSVHPQVERVNVKLPYAATTARVDLLPILDVDLPVLERCQAFEALVQQTLTSVATRIDPNAIVHPPLREADDCRPLETAITVQKIHAAFGPAFADPDAVPVIVYISNADAPFYQPLQAIMDAETLAYFDGGQLRALAMSAVSLPVNLGTFLDTAQWTYALDPKLPATLDALVARTLPFRRFEQSFAEPHTVRAAFTDVVAMRLCKVSEGVVLTPNIAFTPGPPPAGPLVAQFARITGFEPAYAFGDAFVEVSFELCRGYCGPRLFETWFDRDGCAP